MKISRSDLAWQFILTCILALTPLSCSKPSSPPDEPTTAQPQKDPLGDVAQVDVESDREPAADACVSVPAEWKLSSSTATLPKYKDRSNATQPYAASVNVAGSAGAINANIYGSNTWFDNAKMNFPFQPASGENKTLFYQRYMTQFNQFFEGGYFNGKFNNLSLTLLRMPGGLQANHEEWRKLTGPFENRPIRRANGTDQIAIAGIDEHLERANRSGFKIIYTINAYPLYPPCPWPPAISNCSAEEQFEYAVAEAQELARYIRQYENDRFAGKRVVTHYEIGNELNSSLNVGAPNYITTVEEYGRRVGAMTRAIKEVAPGVLVGALDDFNKKQGNEWYGRVYDNANGNMDFWIKHFYSPGSDGNVRGVTLFKKSIELVTSASLPQSGTYKFEFLAEGTRSLLTRPGFSFSIGRANSAGGIDWRSAGSVTIDTYSGLNQRKAKFYALSAQADAGINYFKITSSSVVNWQNLLTLHPSVGATIGTSETVVDFKSDPEYAMLVTAGAEFFARKIESDRTYLRDKPFLITEWNSIYSFDECSGVLASKPSRCSKNTQLREAINTADYYRIFMEKKDIVSGANFWLLLTEIGNVNLPSPAPAQPFLSYYLNQLYANTMVGTRYSTTMTGAPTFGVNANGMIMGSVNDINVTYSLLTSTSSKNCSEFNVALVNKHASQAARVTLNVGGATVKSSGTGAVWQIWDADLAARSSTSNSLLKSFSLPYTLSSGTLTITLPAHSISVVKLPTS